MLSRSALVALLSLGLALAWAPSSAFAATTTVTVDFFDAGFFGSDGRNSKEDGEALGKPTTAPTFANYHAGLSSGYSPTGAPFPDKEVRNFFIFDWTEIVFALGGPPPGEIIGATLHLYNPGDGVGDPGSDGMDGYVSPDASEDYLLSDIGAKTPAEVMDHYDHPFGGPYSGTDESGDAMMVFDELASGPTFATVTMSSADDGTYVDLVLSAIGIDYLNIDLADFGSGGDDFVGFGGKVTTITPGQEEPGDTMAPIDDPDEEVFGFTHPNGEGLPDTSATPPSLTLVFAPEPGTGLLLGLGLALVGARRRAAGR